VCHLNLKENELARPTLRHAHDLLNKFKHKFSHSDFEYLSAYTYVASQIAISDDDSKTYTPPNWNEVDLSSVSKHYLTKFPLREHPCWNENDIQ